MQELLQTEAKGVGKLEDKRERQGRASSHAVPKKGMEPLKQQDHK